jgi:hypothetical protein
MGHIRDRLRVGHRNRPRPSVTDRTVSEHRGRDSDSGRVSFSDSISVGVRYGHGHRAGHRRGHFDEPTAPLGQFLRCTGRPSRSALVAPPFRLAALRWREVILIFVRIQPPAGVSTACLLAVTSFSGRPFPGEPHTVLCPSKLERNRHNTV